MTTTSTTITTTHAHNPAREMDRWSNVGTTVSYGAVATAICTLFNPITGAVVGTYFITKIATEALLICTYKDTLLKVLQTIVPCLTGLTACLAVQGALIGVSAIFNPIVIISVAAAVGLNVFLATCYSFGPDSDAAWRQYKDFWSCKKS